jgi:Ala-tRNA(Pro) deacylase
MTRPASQEELLAELSRLGIASQTVQHPPVFTVDEARTWRGDISGGHTKNLFLTDRKGRLFLAVTLEDVQVDLKALSTAVGINGRFSFATAELLRQHLGVEPGSVTPFALINDRQKAVTALFDECMLEVELLNFHPLANTATTGISSADLLKFAEAQGHKPLRLRFPQK